MSDARDAGPTGAGRFEGIDPRLNVFALANGMDLSKGPGYRRLEWFTEGLERGILIETDGDTAFRVAVLAWKTGTQEIRSRSEVGDALTLDQVGRVLSDAIDAANELE